MMQNILRFVQLLNKIFQVHLWWNLGLAMCIIYLVNREASWT